MVSQPSEDRIASPEDAELEALLAYREAEELDSDEVVTDAAALENVAASRSISKRATELIIEYETGGRAYYERHYKSRPVWPKASSGITIGCGYDLGYVSPAVFRSDWASLLGALSTAQRAALTACVGFHSGKHPAAKMQALLATVQDIKVPWETALTVFEQRTLPLFIAETAAALPNTDKLNGDCFGALVSLTFNRGASYAKPHVPSKDPLDRYREMRAIKALMARERFAQIPGEIRSMVRIWAGTAIETGMRRRRTDEAALFAEGLATRAVAGAAPVIRTEALFQAEPRDAASHIVAHPEMPADAQSWDGPTDEDHWEETGEDEVVLAALENRSFGTRAAGATWAPDAVQPDYAHLGGDLAVGGSFALKAEDLALLAAANDFDVGVLGDDAPVLFGLRGAGIVKDHDAPGGIVLVDQRPDHISPRCVIGVWDRGRGKISVFPGSTVPNRHAVAKYKAERTAGNLLPTGFYHYVCGPHTTKNQSTPGAFLLRNPDMSKRVVLVRRSVDDLSYDRGDLVDPCAPGDNIHPTFYTGTAAFSSLGCQTVVGAHQPGTHRGPWAAFRKAAGLTNYDGVPGKRFVYMLLTGAEARIAAQLRTADLGQDRIALRRLRRLRFGSQGPAVRRLQERLGLANPDASIGKNTAQALHVRQSGIGKPVGSDGIYTPALDEALGWGVFV
jgi:GH24 family phage-related lysozyme (muramidase)